MRLISIVIFFVFFGVNFQPLITEAQSINSMVKGCSSLQTAFDSELSGEFKRAILNYKQALNCFDDQEIHRKINLKIGLFYKLINQPQEAIKFLKKAISDSEQDEISFAAIKKIASIKFNNGEYEQATEFTNRLISEYPDKNDEVGKAQLMLAWSSFNQKNYKGVIKKFSNLDKKYPNVAIELTDILALAHFNENDFGEAKNLLIKFQKEYVNTGKIPVTELTHMASAKALNFNWSTGGADESPWFIETFSDDMAVLEPGTTTYCDKNFIIENIGKEYAEVQVIWGNGANYSRDILAAGDFKKYSLTAEYPQSGGREGARGVRVDNARIINSTAGTSKIKVHCK